MSLLGWLVVGVVCGLLANAITHSNRVNRILDIALGVAGAAGGGFMFSSFGGTGIRGLNLYSMVVAAIGAVAALLTYHELFVYPGDRGD